MDHMLQATALVNEAYVQLVNVNRIQWQNRANFLAIAVAVFDPRMSQVVELRFFGRLSVQETADVFQACLIDRSSTSPL